MTLRFLAPMRFKDAGCENGTATGAEQNLNGGWDVNAPYFYYIAISGTGLVGRSSLVIDHRTFAGSIQAQQSSEAGCEGLRTGFRSQEDWQAKNDK